MSEYVKIFRSMINALPQRVAVPALAMMLAGVVFWFSAELSAMQVMWDERFTPVEEAMREQSQMLRYLACVDRRGGPEGRVREHCANDHLSESLRQILGGP